MSTWLVRAVIVAALSDFGVLTEALAQAPDQAIVPSLGAVKEQVPIGDVVYVTDRTGATIKGNLIGISDDAIDMRVNRTVKNIRAADVGRIQWEKRDSLVNGIVIGGAVGAIPGIYWLIADPNECSGLCPEDYAAIGVGALVGGLIDLRIKKKVTAYESASRKSTTVTFSPLLVGNRRGLRVDLMF